MNYLAVRLKAGERWSYQPPAEHTVLWTAVGRGSVLVPDELQQGELVAFRPSNAAIEFEAQSDAEFVLGSAVPHDYDLVLGSHSVHTSAEALREAEARISAIQTRLIQQGKALNNGPTPVREAAHRRPFSADAPHQTVGSYPMVNRPSKPL